MLFSHFKEAVIQCQQGPNNEATMAQTFDEFMDVADGPFAEQVEVNGTTMEVVIEGSTMHASSTAARLALMDCLAARNQTGGGGNKKRSRRNAVINSSRGGGDGIHFGAALFIKDNTDKVNAAKKAVDKSKESIKAKTALISKLEEFQNSKPDTYWHHSELRGKSLAAVCKLCEIKTASLNADAQRLAFKDLNITQQQFDGKLQDLRGSLLSEQELLLEKEAALAEAQLNVTAGERLMDGGGESDDEGDYEE